MKFAIISGSHRTQSQSAKVARYLASRLAELTGEQDQFVFELAANPLPLWDEGIFQGNGPALAAWKPVSGAIAQCDGAIIISPEWGGMVPAGLKNFFLLAGDGCLYHKPGLLVGVSSARNGAYPIAELRVSSYKNTHINYIPEQLIVRFVTDVLNEAEAVSEEDKTLRARIDYSLKVLIEYAKALKAVRGSGVLDRKAYPYGM